MVSEKVIVVLLIVSIIFSIVSITTALNVKTINTENVNFGSVGKTSTSDKGTGNVKLTIEGIGGENEQV